MKEKKLNEPRLTLSQLSTNQNPVSQLRNQGEPLCHLQQCSNLPLLRLDRDGRRKATPDDGPSLKEWLYELRMEKIERMKKLEIKNKMKNALKNLPMAILLAAPNIVYASVESMVSNVETLLLNVVAPFVCLVGIAVSGFKLAMGDESAKAKLLWSCFGTVIAFTAPTILDYLQNRVAA